MKKTTVILISDHGRYKAGDEITCHPNMIPILQAKGIIESPPAPEAPDAPEVTEPTSESNTPEPAPEVEQEVSSESKPKSSKSK